MISIEDEFNNAFINGGIAMVVLGFVVIPIVVSFISWEFTGTGVRSVLIGLIMARVLYHFKKKDTHD